jgi:hypothetical protein
VAHGAVRTCLPLRGQLRAGAGGTRAAPHSRFTRREGFAADTCVARFYPARRVRSRARPPSFGRPRRASPPPAIILALSMTSAPTG